MPREFSEAMSHPTRRSVLAAGLALPLALPKGGPEAARRGRAKRQLVLGGTRFLGPPIVEHALAKGFEVTLFNRGKTDPKRFAQLEQRIGDRDRGDLEALKTGKWDAVIDTSGYAPAHVKASAELLRDRVEQYLFVSTISVYASTAAAMVGEDTPVAKIDDATAAQASTIQEASRHYGAMKARCEQAAETAMPGRVAQVRPGLIVGPEDNTDRFTYWPIRVGQGGEVLAPGNPDQEVQFIDVRDLGEWCVRLCADKKFGVWNAVGLPMRLSIQELLHGCKVAQNADASFTWVAEKFLLENKVRAYTELPLWLPSGQRGHIDNRRAIADGLLFRSVAETIRATVAAFAKESPQGRVLRAGLSRERESALLELWKKR